MKIIQIKLTLIVPYSKNHKKHSKEQIQKVANSIQRFGFIQPLVVDKDNNIVIGHCRYEASKLLKLKEIPCVVVDNLTEDEIKALRIADNKLNESDWSMDLVIEELKELKLNSFDITLTGFDTDLILEPEEKDDEVPEAPNPMSKLGDIYELGHHRIMCGDSTKIEDVEKLMDGKKADMVFTDPPYGIDFSGSMSNTTKDGVMIKHKGANQKYDTIENDSLSDEEFIKMLNDAIAMIKQNCTGAWYISFGTQTLDVLLNILQKNDMRWKSIIVWMKNQATLSGKDYKGRYEPIVYGRFNKEFYGKRYKQEDIWEFQRTLKNDLHPTMKPVPLIQNAINNSSKQEDIVLDLFLGSGSTLIACEKTNRICYGMELDPKYMDVIVQRYVNYTGNEKIKLNGKEIIFNKTIC